MTDDNTHARRIAEQLNMADGDVLPRLHVGDHVIDRDADEDDSLDIAAMLVVGLDTLRADAYKLADDGPTVADVNPAYPATDDVVEVTFPQRTDLDVEKKRYAYPRSRLRLEHPLHNRDAKEGDSE
ncbi:hypothetical protein C5C07_15320 [Haloferax sp. Atlit-4N]|uniref:hypothetical protein n=1 Tax=Haloferax sp. Atlit-4N TaxID=2077206 RepID=UPI000E22F139|nr:hypothetical protein [Haloferax sp. Atlit-4N]RDZ53103.1 hypothetical protein C5C07_15320 [Haloferax sp. Atlit-4N]